MATVFASFGKVVGNNKGSIQNFGIVGITVATEEIAKFVFFYCPCNYPKNKMYGMSFILGPAIILFIAGFLAHRRTWRLVTGLCNRTQGVGRGGKRIIHFIFIFLQISSKAVIAPATWFLLAMLKGDYYACANWPNPYIGTDVTRVNLHMPPKNNSNLPEPCEHHFDPKYFKHSLESEIIARNLRAESHVIGWFFVCIGMFVGVIVMCLGSCRSRFSYEQSNYIDRYREAEIDAFEDALSEKASAQAKLIVDHYFSKPRDKLQWDQIAVINDKVTKSKRGRPIYSPLHNFVNKEKRKEELKDEPDLLGGSATKENTKSKAKKQNTKPLNTSNNNGGENGALLASAAMMATTTGRQGDATRLATNMMMMRSLHAKPENEDEKIRFKPEMKEQVVTAAEVDKAAESSSTTVASPAVEDESQLAVDAQVEMKETVIGDVNNIENVLQEPQLSSIGDTEVLDEDAPLL